MDAGKMEEKVKSRLNDFYLIVWIPFTTEFNICKVCYVNDTGL